MTKIISISDEAYEKLKKMKNGYSFSKVIIELTKTRSNIMDFAGKWEEKEAKKIAGEIAKERKVKSWRIQ